MIIRHSLFSATAAVALVALSQAAMSETLNGTSGPDVLTGKPGASKLAGGGKSDVLYGEPVAGVGKPRKIERIGLTSEGQQATFGATNYSVTPDGATLLFLSDSAEFPGSPFTNMQVFSKKLSSGAVKLQSTSDNGAFDLGATIAVISPNGRYAAIVTRSTNITGAIVPPMNAPQLILKDLKTGTYKLVSQYNGAPASAAIHSPTFSPDSSRLAFVTAAGDLDPSDSNGYRDVFVVKVSEPTVVYRASTNKFGSLALGGDSARPVFSPDGATLAFDSAATNLLAIGVVDKNANGRDVFLKSLAIFDPVTRTVRGAVTLAATDANGVQDSIGESFAPAFSPDGREVAFVSSADHLVAVDTTDFGPDVGADIYIKTIGAGVPDRPTGTVRIVSRSGAGTQGIGNFNGLAFSPDGARLAFLSSAKNLAAGADNGVDQLMIKDLTKAADLGAVTLVSRRTGAGNVQGDDHSVGSATFIHHGVSLVFESNAGNLVGDDSNGLTDIFQATLAAPKSGNDTIAGGKGRDVIAGGRGADVLRGGKGADVFVYLSVKDSPPAGGKSDVILDFSVGEHDLIDLSAIDANTLMAGNQAFKFVGAAKFDGRPGRLRYTGGVLSADVDGDRVADFVVRMNVAGSLTKKNIRR